MEANKFQAIFSKPVEFLEAGIMDDPNNKWWKKLAQAFQFDKAELPAPLPTPDWKYRVILCGYANEQAADADEENNEAEMERLDDELDAEAEEYDGEEFKPVSAARTLQVLSHLASIGGIESIVECNGNAVQSLKEMIKGAQEDEPMIYIYYYHK